MTIRCPKCGASEWNIWCMTTAMYGPGNITTYNCTSCGNSWQDDKCDAVMASPIECEIQSKYGEIKDWLVENYNTRDDVDVVYGALCQLLDVLNENALRGLR